MIEVKNISKVFTDESGYSVNLLKNISMDIPKEKITAVIAPSSAGKTSLLKIICGLENQTEGELIGIEKKDVSFIPSESSTFPWLNTYENITFALKEKNENFIKNIISIVGLEGYEEHYPHNKSYGYRLRTALGRALVRKPALIVIDEPFNKMEEITKGEIYNLVLEINRELKTTFLIATTNISEAVYLSDKIYLMQKNPAKVFNSVDIDFQSKRDFSILSSEKFGNYRLEIEKSFKSIDSQKLLSISV